ncbi:type II toxin-antitoxin system PemK/MazF family toxin [Kineosporia sp. A_224]|uniref:type II toxin-antitoxin system PemK/MazF family toxin n=1 Tax=Kineosporia sp. A_224 TaxID=1962180 RepID=UPI0018E984CE|nr:type II toxin-antitoxin system PemK/MazF family toxin [Kineosporia sp. A_224]
MAQGLAGSFGKALGRALAAGAEAAVRSLLRSPSKRTPTSPRPARRDAQPQPRPRPRPQQQAAPTSDGYPGDFTGRAVIEYRPDPDGQADPGEVVWGWVPFEEDHSQGKDRPVLVIGRDGDWLLGLMLTSKDHDRDAAQEARAGRQWTDVGSGPWDPKRRPSEVRLDRVVRLDPAAVRREGGTMPKGTFDAVAEQVRAVNGWA